MRLIKKIKNIFPGFCCSQWILFLVIILTGLSCGLKIGEKSLVDDIEGFSIGCLNGVDKKANLYIKGQLTVQQINQMSNCIKKALVLFKDRVHGRKKGEFTPKELRKFIQDLFLQDQVINDNLLAQFARLKAVIIGGNEHKLTAEDIESFIDFVDILKTEAIFFRPYIQALNISYNERQSNDKDLLSTIESALKQSIARIFSAKKNFSKLYLFIDLEIFIREMMFFFNRHYEIPDLNQKIDLLRELKRFIAGGSDTAIEPDEWEGFLSGCAHLVSASINYSLLKKSTFISPEGMGYLSVVINSLLNFLDLSLKNRQGSAIKESDFLKLIPHLKKVKIISEKLRNQTIRNILLILFGKIFNSKKDRYGIIELRADHLKKMYEIMQIREDIQSFLDQSFLDHISGKKDFYESITDSKHRRSFFSSPDSVFAGETIINEILSLKPLYKEGKKIYLSREIYKENKSKNTWDYKNMTIYNFFHLIARMIRIGYEKNYPEKSGMTQEELNAFFVDFTPIGQDMKWYYRAEKSVFVAGEAEFIAANVLTPSAKGFNPDWKKEEYLTSSEIVEYLAYAFSFGFALKEFEMDLEICNENNEDSMEYSHQEEALYNIDCIRVHLISVLHERTGNMLELQKVLAKMNTERKKQLMEALIHIAFESEKKYKESLNLKRIHLKNIIIALYFIETTMNRYDLNDDLVLQDDEIWFAFPSFKGYLSRALIYLLCQESDSMADATYAYTIEKRKLPAGKDFSLWDSLTAKMEIYIYDIARNWNINYWELYLDRERLTYVYSHIVKGLLFKKGEEKQCLRSFNLYDNDQSSIIVSPVFEPMYGPLIKIPEKEKKPTSN